jgi:hypothetical protein
MENNSYTFHDYRVGYDKYHKLKEFLNSDKK